MTVSDEDLIAKWKPIINSVSKSNVPSDLLHRLVLKLNGEEFPKQKTINIKKLRQQGVSSEDIDVIIDMTLSEFNDNIKTVDMFVDVEAVASYVQPITDRILRQ